MAMRSLLSQHVLDLLWSQWRELGVPATAPSRHEQDCLDPEALIAFTALHADLDARLRDESLDWLLRYDSFVSRARLKNILKAWRALDDPLFARYAATLDAHGRAGWLAGQAQPLAFHARSRSALHDLRSPALMSLRIRALCGVGARAELLRALLSRPSEARTASELAVETSYGKRNVLNELEPLRLAGFVRSFRSLNAERYQLVRDADLAAMLRPVPTHFTPWTHAFHVLHLALGLIDQSTERTDLENAVEAVRLLSEHETDFARAGVSSPTMPGGAVAWSRFVDWSTEYARSLARA